MFEIDIVTTDGDQLTVRLPHAPRPNKVASLREELSENGWEGRPVILAEHDGYVYALTGVHRLSAAGLEIPVPIVWLPDDLSAADWDQIDWAVDNYDLLDALRDIASRRDDMEDVVSVMYWETLGQGSKGDRRSWANVRRQF